MKEHTPFLRTTDLFRGMADDEIARMLKCLHAREIRINKPRILWDVSEQPYWGILVQGGLATQQEDSRGNRSILSIYSPGDFLSESSVKAMPDAQPFILSVQAGTVILLLEQETAPDLCKDDGDFARTYLLFLRNAAQALMRREQLLMHRIICLGKRSTRDKLMSFLATQSVLQGARRISVPLTRQELADMLAVDRSAMCTELSRMQNDGLIRYERKRFELLE